MSPENIPEAAEKIIGRGKNTPAIFSAFALY
jgi:hypothetical protein